MVHFAHSKENPLSTLPSPSDPGELTTFAYNELDGGAFAPHQAVGIQWLYDRPRSLLADDVGLGKTVQAAGLIAMLKDRDELGHCLVIVPASLIPQWRQELARWVPSLVVSDTTEPALCKPNAKNTAAYLSAFPDGAEALLTSYDFAHARVGQMELDEYDTVILDEASSIKGGSKQHQSVGRICASADRVHALTASPFENDATESYEILAAVGTPGLWSREDFRRRFVVWSEPWTDGYGRTVEPKPIGLVHDELPTLRAYLKDVYLRRTADEVGLSLPKHTGVRLMWVPLHAAQQAALDAAERRWRPSIKLHHEREAAVTMAGGRSSKAEAALAFVESRPDEPKFVVWAFHLAHLSVMAGLLDRRRIGWARIDGTMKDAERTAALQRFHDDPECRVLLGTDVIGVGLNLQYARVLLSLGSSYNPGKEGQREGRIRRIGSPHTTYEHVTFLSQAPHEERKAWTLYRKNQDAEAVFGQDVSATIEIDEEVNA